MDRLKDKIKQIPSVARVLVEYEKLYGRKKSREMFDYLVNEVESFIINLTKTVFTFPTSIKNIKQILAIKHKEEK